MSYAEKMVAAGGATIGIFCVFLISQCVLPTAVAMGVIASMGASAVLLYAVPHGPLSQPWPVLGGHCISAIIGVVSSQCIGDRALATAVAVGVAIGMMHQLKCIHPPGGATAFTAVMGGDSIRDLGFAFVACPVLLNVGVMLLLAVVINYPFPWRRYPAALITRPGNQRLDTSVSAEDHRHLVEAMRSLDSFVDASEEDLVYIAQEIGKRYRRDNGPR